MDIKQIFAGVAMAVGFVTCMATANAADQEADFLECLGDHQDTDGIGVCCVYYGGTYDDQNQECWDYPGATVAQDNAARPETPPKQSVLTRVPNHSIASLG